jgi:hypothetical protein
MTRVLGVPFDFFDTGRIKYKRDGVLVHYDPASAEFDHFSPISVWACAAFLLSGAQRSVSFSRPFVVRRGGPSSDVRILPGLGAFLS